MVLPTPPTLSNITTADELFAAGDIGRCELVRGELVMMSPAGGEHGRIAAWLAIDIGVYVQANRLGDVYAAETGFVIEHEPDTVRAPDVGFISAQRARAMRTRKFLRGAPDLAVEVVSPDDRPRELAEKVKNWLDHGTRLVWVVDPQEQTVTSHRLGGQPLIHRAGDTLSGEDVLPGYELKVARIFGDYEYEYQP